MLLLLLQANMPSAVAEAAGGGGRTCRRGPGWLAGHAAGFAALHVAMWLVYRLSAIAAVWQPRGLYVLPLTPAACLLCLATGHDRKCSEVR